MSLKVYYPSPIKEESIALLNSHLIAGIHVQTGDLPQPADYQVLVSGRPSSEQLAASANLKTMIVPWAGLPKETTQLLANYPELSVHNLHHNAQATGETALMLLFAAAKQIIPVESRFREHDWRPRYESNPARILAGKQMLILGYGAIGRYVGQVASAMGMQVKAIKRKPLNEEQASTTAEVYTYEKLHSLLPESDILMITLPLTNDTLGMIAAEEISLLPDGAILVNVGRGPVVDQEALYEALKSKKLHGAGIDVWYNYPADPNSRSNTAPSDFPFETLENIVMSPHRGGSAVEVEPLRMKALADLLNAAARGETVPNRVNLQQGY